MSTYNIESVRTPPHMPVCPAVFLLPFSHGSRWLTWKMKTRYIITNNKTLWVSNTRLVHTSPHIVVTMLNDVYKTTMWSIRPFNANPKFGNTFRDFVWITCHHYDVRIWTPQIIHQKNDVTWKLCVCRHYYSLNNKLIKICLSCRQDFSASKISLYTWSHILLPLLLRRFLLYRLDLSNSALKSRNMWRRVLSFVQIRNK